LILIHLLVFVLIAVPAYILLCLVRPVRKCPACQGRKVVPSRESPFATCKKCKGHGRAYRFGASLVQRVTLEQISPWIQDKYQDTVDRLRDRAS
jgi:hypothetical protein